jgi:hypothetical protein
LRCTARNQQCGLKQIPQRWQFATSQSRI